jgi:asparagine synthase (glutamine-hydrolysing)
MCGITGFVNIGSNPDAGSILERMSGSLIHRGPDDSGSLIWPSVGAEPSRNDPACDLQVGLAMRRLAIIDLATGHQPMANEDETCWIVFNGEIYNHQQLRGDLEAKGHRFRSQADTEAILHAYEEYGVDCVKQLRGMFAFAIWDQRRERLFLARDFVGIKPLYWTRTPAAFLFASEIKSLLVHPQVGREVDEIALSDYLTYLYVPPPRTMFAGICKLPPGHRLIWERGAVTVEEYWSGPASLLEQPSERPVGASEVWDAISETVGAHLLSDVPLGAFLSGGLDSLAVVAAMADLCEEPPQTFTVGFRDGGLYNEVDAARAASRHFGTRHHELTIGPECVEDLPEIVRMLDEPLADASVLPNYAVARLARQEVTVALSGAGGDELFAGYQRYRGEELAGYWKHVPGPFRRSVLLPALRRFPSSGNTRLGDRVRLAQKFLEPLGLPSDQRYLAWNTFFDDRGKAALGLNGATKHHSSWQAALPYFDRVRHRPFVDRAMYVDLKTYLPGDPLFLADRMTMAHSLEGRTPFVDTRLMEFAYQAPGAQKLRGGITKALMREALADRAPEALLRRPKRGFGTPTDVWLRGPWRSLAENLLSPQALRRAGYFDPAHVASLLAEHQQGARDLSQHVWALLVFQLWHRLFIEPGQVPTGPVTLADLDAR